MGNVNCCAANQPTLQFKLGQKIFEDEEHDNTNFNNNNNDNSNKPLIEINSKYSNNVHDQYIEPRISSSIISKDQNNQIAKLTLIQNNAKIFLAKVKAITIFNQIKMTLIEEMKSKYLSNIKIVAENKSEQFYNTLIDKEIITPFTFTDYYKEKIKRLSKYTFETPYIMIGNKTVYNGSWNCNQRYHGYGTLYKSNETKVEGLWNNGELNGLGRFFTSNNEYLIGNFNQGAVNGQAIFYHNDGSMYSGEWKDDIINGIGIETFKDGATFEGVFIDGKKVNGKFSWKDGTYYQGSLCNELFEGNGIYYWGANRIYEGQWKAGQMNGEGKLSYVDGSFYHGHFKDGLRHGKGKYYWNERKYYEGEWFKGQQHGQGVYYKNGTITNGSWIKGKISNLSKKHSKTKLKNDKNKEKEAISITTKLLTIDVPIEDNQSDIIESDSINNHIHNIK